ncbi:hypothetical protein [Candidatus Chlorohelix sp.]|uniref:hypothetical protein n=1 Tax=Candidatus Chlorohelix sp. TaxID=3139201 RepID=UPI00304E48E8
MADHFACIGYRFENQEDWNELIIRSAQSGGIIQSNLGFYSLLAPGAGIEVWTQLDEEKITGCNPHFHGSSRVKVGIAKIWRSEEWPLEGSIHCWANPNEQNPEQGDYAFVVDVPDLDLAYEKLECPGFATLQLAAFAHQLECYRDEETYYNSQSRQRKFAAESFFPTGLFQAPEGEQATPPATAIFAGHIEAVETRTNPDSGYEFLYMSIKTLAMTLDVVADPEMVKGEPILGGVISGSFWISGRVVE